MKTPRCAIYTRKSTEEGLDQVFNTLDAQREACESYIKSQAGEGWKALREQYDDGGFSGGNMDRPAVQRLLADVDAGKVDVIVVYKVDRLTRSLMDFARIVERLDARGVSFVSVTQAFNTTTSMGRLTLNVLLSFAQFEREVTGERIRDKIAASKAKGMWMGGNVPLGYDLHDRCLIVNQTEAEQVRYIFRRYLELGSGLELAKELRAQRIVSKRCTSRDGKERGGLPFSCGALYYLLQNRLYVGEIVHREIRHSGQHERIVPLHLFDEVQAALSSNRRKRSQRTTRETSCPLAGRVYASNDHQLTTSFSYGRGGRLYRYYVSPELTPAGALKCGKSGGLRVPASPLERLVLGSVRQLIGQEARWGDVHSLLERVELWGRSIQLVLSPEPLLEPCEQISAAAERLQGQVRGARMACSPDGKLRMVIDRSPKFRGGAIDTPETSNRDGGQDIVRLRDAHVLLERFSMSPLNPDAHNAAKAPPYQRERRAMHLGLISPRLQRELVLSRGSDFVNQLQDASALPLAWADHAGWISDNRTHDKSAKMS